MRLMKFAALSLLLAAGLVPVPVERAAAQPTDQAPPPATQQPTPPPPDQGAPPPPPPTQAAPPPAASSAPAAQPPARIYSNVNLRNGPGTSYAIVTLIPAGSSVDVADCKAGWCAVGFQGQNGYIIQSSLSPPVARPRYAPGYGGPPPVYAEPPPGYYPPPPPPYGYYPYYRPYWGWHRGYWRRW